MTLTTDIRNKVRDLLSGNYDEVELEYVPTVDNVSLRKKYVKTTLCAMFIDLRNSSEMLISRWKQSSAKVHKAYANVVVDVVNAYGGKVRSFQGDGILSFWPAYYKSQISNAVKASMVLTWMLGTEFEKYFKPYFDVDFGIGINWDEAYVIRAGSTDKKENNDLIYITKAVNKAVVLAKKQSLPNHIGITESTYSNLPDETLYAEDKRGNAINMWSENYFNFVNREERYLETNYHWSIE